MSCQNASLHLVCVFLTMSHLMIVTISVSSFSLSGCKGAACMPTPCAGAFLTCFVVFCFVLPCCLYGGQGLAQQCGNCPYPMLLKNVPWGQGIY